MVSITMADSSTTEVALEKGLLRIEVHGSGCKEVNGIYERVAENCYRKGDLQIVYVDYTTDRVWQIKRGSMILFLSEYFRRRSPLRTCMPPVTGWIPHDGATLAPDIRMPEVRVPTVPVVRCDLAQFTKFGSSDELYVEAALNKFQLSLTAKLAACDKVREAVKNQSIPNLRVGIAEAKAAQVPDEVIGPAQMFLCKLEAVDVLLDAMTKDDIPALSTALHDDAMKHVADGYVIYAQDKLRSLRLKGANIVLSVKYDVNGVSPYSQLLAAGLKRRNLHVYNPNAYTKRDCNIECSLNGFNCKKVPYQPPRKPTVHDCWQTNYRWHLEFPDEWGQPHKAAIMLAVKEDGALGSGQLTEKKMAEQMGILRLELNAPAAYSLKEFGEFLVGVAERLDNVLSKAGIISTASQQQQQRQGTSGKSNAVLVQKSINL